MPVVSSRPQRRGPGFGRAGAPQVHACPCPRPRRALGAGAAGAWPRLLAALLAREDLTADDTRWALTEVMDDAHEPAQLAAFLTALRHRGLRHAAPVRRALGVPTAINYMARLTNSARPGTALIGCSSLALAPVLAAVLA